MNIVQECRYMYLVPKGHRDYPDGHYGSLMAVSMSDAKKHLSRWCRGVIVVRARLGKDGCDLADCGTQEYRKEIFEKAMASGRNQVSA